MTRVSQRGVTLIEVLAAAVIIFVVLAAAIGAYFVSVFQGAREIVDTETKAVSRSIEDAIRAGSRLNIAPDHRSFFADVEGVRLFIPLPQPGQPAVDLPDYNEDTDPTTHGPNLDPPSATSLGDIDWDQDGRLRAPAFAKPETIRDNVDHDGDGVSWAAGDTPANSCGRPEPFGPPVNGRSPAYDNLNSDDDGVDRAIDDVALYIYPLGLLCYVQDGAYREGNVPFTWSFQTGMTANPVVLAPMDEDTDHNGVIPTGPASASMVPPFEAALNLNLVPGTAVGPAAQYLPDTYEDLDRNGRITIGGPGSIIRDINGNTTSEFYEFSEDFNLNGFLDVPAPSQFPGAIYFHTQYTASGAARFRDPLTEGFFQTGVGDQPLSGANFSYSAQVQQSRTFGYSLHVQRVEDRGGSSQGYGTIHKTVYRFTISLYFDYVRTLREFQNGNVPDPIRVQIFEVTIE